MSESGLTEETIRGIGDRLLGTCNTVRSIVGRMGVELPFGKDDADIESDLEGINIERCPYCLWWMESFELINDECEVVGCSDCRNDDRAVKENDKDD